MGRGQRGNSSNANRGKEGGQQTRNNFRHTRNQWAETGDVPYEELMNLIRLRIPIKTKIYTKEEIEQYERNH